MTSYNDQQPSPHWGSTTKLILGLTIVAIVAALLVRFRGIIGPMILAFVLAYLIHPVAGRFSRFAHIPWRTAVSLIYLLLVIIIALSLTFTGLAIVQQVQSLIGVVQRFITQLPVIATELSTRTYMIGPFALDFSQFDLTSLANQLLAGVQPVLGRLGGLVGTLAASALTTLGWLVFVVLISYFILADANQFPDELVHVDIPGYNVDVRRLGYELSKTWNAFLRGQLIILLLVLVSYTLLMTALGVRYAIAIALLAGLARFVPYIGPLTTWTVTVLVAFFQGSNYFGLPSVHYAILVVACALILDQIFDNLIGPRIIGESLGVHPAAVLVAAIIGANLIGIVGLVLAAPVLASLMLLGRYVTRKMLDLDPWAEMDEEEEVKQAPPKIFIWVRRVRAWLRMVLKRSRT
ncbi:MAG: AI-2E family transporter [Anaerolineales bacterium]|jgi:predicted PurR-regulated permease PerM